MQKFYIDYRGGYLGSFDCTALPEEKKATWLAEELARVAPNGATEVPSAPNDARAIWNGRAWNEPIPRSEAATLIEQVAELKTKIAILETKVAE